MSSLIAAPGLSSQRGFLPLEDPLARLPKPFEAWEAIAAALPKHFASDHIRQTIERLSPFPVSSLSGERELERAMVLLSYLGHAYVWGGKKPADRLPEVLAVPWYAVAQRLGRPPVLSYSSYALHNFFRLDPQREIECGNIALLQNFLGGIDEEWFILDSRRDRTESRVRGGCPACLSRCGRQSRR